MLHQYIEDFKPKGRLYNQKRQVWCMIRNKYVAATPEELVRQLLLFVLTTKKGYTAGVVGVETSLKVNGLDKRADVLVYDTKAQPLLICECKASSVKLNSNVIDQAAAYNMGLSAKAILLTNGNTTLFYLYSKEEEMFQQTTLFPDYQTLLTL